MVTRTRPQEPTTDPEFSVDIEEEEHPRGVIDIVVDGYPYALNLGQIATSGATTEGWLFWVDLLSRAQREFMKLDAAYRQFRANAICRMLEKDAKLSEWKAKAFIEKTDVFRENKEALAESRRTLGLLQGIVEGYGLGPLSEPRGMMMCEHLEGPLSAI